MPKKAYPYKYGKPRPGRTPKTAFEMLPRTEELEPPKDGEPPSMAYLGKLLGHIKKGVPWALAAKAEGLDPDEHDRWLERGVMPNAPEPYRTYARRVYASTIRLLGDAIGAAHAGAKKKNPLAIKVFMEMRFPNGLLDLRGDGREDPVSDKRVRRRALREALSEPNTELRAIMDEAGLVSLTDAQREVLREAGLLKDPAVPQLVVSAESEYPPIKEDDT